MSASNKNAGDSAASQPKTTDTASNSARKGASTNGATNASQTITSPTLRDTGQATLASGPASNIPMAEANVDVNRSERLFPAAAESPTKKGKVN